MLFAAGHLSACAHTSRPSGSIPAKESAAMTSTTASAVNSNPTLDAEQIGRRFLKLIESLKSRSDLSEQRIREATGIELKPGESGPFYSQPLQADWYYILHYVPESASLKRGVGLEFGNRADRHADMSPICSLSLQDYHGALEAMGFHGAQTTGEIGQPIDWRYHRNDISLSIVAWPQAGSHDASSQRNCVRSIATLN
ncbi:hypothetical protein [Pseudomonas sp. CGJS7]|uniref:hypothetical protein n=1 Tax=Pseudomonas sp. CGJS7 TaxID=3109348 RepID=UPI0030099425